MEKKDTIRIGGLPYEEKESLLSLLREYEEKLMVLCQKISDIDGNIITYRLSFLLPFLMLIFFFLGRYFMSFYFTVPFYFTAIFFIIFAIMFYIGTTTQQKQKKFRLIRNEARRIATRLEKVVRVGYQIQENMDFNVVTKVELDLRLADAEYALAYYHSLVKEE